MSDKLLEAIEKVAFEHGVYGYPVDAIKMLVMADRERIIKILQACIDENPLKNSMEGLVHDAAMEYAIAVIKGENEVKIKQ